MRAHITQTSQMLMLLCLNIRPFISEILLCCLLAPALNFCSKSAYHLATFSSYPFTSNQDSTSLKQSLLAPKYRLL